MNPKIIKPSLSAPGARAHSGRATTQLTWRSGMEAGTWTANFSTRLSKILDPAASRRLFTKSTVFRARRYSAVCTGLIRVAPEPGIRGRREILFEDGAELITS